MSELGDGQILPRPAMSALISAILTFLFVPAAAGWGVPLPATS